MNQVTLDHLPFHQSNLTFSPCNWELDIIWVHVLNSAGKVEFCLQYWNGIRYVCGPSAITLLDTYGIWQGLKLIVNTLKTLVTMWLNLGAATWVLYWAIYYAQSFLFTNLILSLNSTWLQRTSEDESNSVLFDIVDLCIPRRQRMTREASTFS